jgi:hypothetical protein
MKFVKFPAQAIIVKLFCDCGKGEMMFTKLAEGGGGFLHTCSNTECGKKVILQQKVPFSGAEILSSKEEDIVIDEVKE